MRDVRFLNGAFCGIPRKDNFSFAAGTTYGCGGTARAAFFPRSEEEGTELYSALLKSGEKFCVLGCGSDVLAQDGFYDGYVLCTKNINGISLCGESGGEVALNVACGVTVGELLFFCKREGLSGLEFLAGIPATAGGLLFMNGGAGGKYIGERVSSVRIFSDKRRELTAEECNFTYKHSTMRDIKCFISGAKLLLKRENTQIVLKKIQNYLSARKNLPRGRSCGCVFENYCGVSAGKIIENAGLKGAREGRAYVSGRHANFIINEGRSSSDVYSLICRVKSEVYEKFGVTLKEEVNYIGDFE